MTKLDGDYDGWAMGKERVSRVFVAGMHGGEWHWED